MIDLDNAAREHLAWVQSGNLYLDVIEDAALMVELGIPAGRLTCQILQNDPFSALRANCHSMVTDEQLLNTIAAIFENISVNRDGCELRVVGSRVMKFMVKSVQDRAKRKAA